MFCVFNAFSHGAVRRVGLPKQEIEKLSKCIGIALLSSLQAYKLRKNQKQCIPSRSEKSQSIIHITPSQEKPQECRSEISPSLLDEKKSVQQTKEIDIKKSEEVIQIHQNAETKKELDVQTKMTIKMKKIKKSKEKKKIEKSLINIMNKKIDLINSTAILPPFKKLNLKQILIKFQQIKMREITQWKIDDSSNKKRNKFFKHLY